MPAAQDQTEEFINLIWNREKYYIVVGGEDAASRTALEEFGVFTHALSDEAPEWMQLRTAANPAFRGIKRLRH